MQGASPVVLVSKAVLVVDLADAAAILADRLHAIGAVVVGPGSCASSAMVLVDQAEHIDVAVIEMDSVAPHGAMVVQRLTARGIPVVVTSGGGQVDVDILCRGAMAIGKPVDLGLVAAALWLGPSPLCG